jgi:hypothetical protein
MQFNKRPETDFGISVDVLKMLSIWVFSAGYETPQMKACRSK